MKILILFAVVFLGWTSPNSTGAQDTKPDDSILLEFVYLGRGDSSGFRSQSLYYVSAVPSDWATAFQSCTTRYKGHLVAIDSNKEDEIINGFLVGRRLDRIWTAGAYDASANGWIWTNTQYSGIYRYDSRWRNGEPSESNDYSRLAFVRNGFKSVWESLNEFNYMYAICEIE